MTGTIPARRLQLSELAAKQYAAMFRLSASVELDQALRDLIDVVINAWNRLEITVRQEPGHYQPGQFGQRRVAAAGH